MFTYPKQAFFDQNLPKKKIYLHAKATSALQKRFVDQVEKITWLYKLAPETLNIAASKSVQEIQIFEIQLKEKELHEDILRAIDRTIRHPIAYQIRMGDEVRFAMPAKRLNEADPSKWVTGEYFWAKCQSSEREYPVLPISLDLEALYEAILRKHLVLEARSGESLLDHVARATKIKQRQREVSQMESRLLKTKQFNHKVELNQKLRHLKSEVESLYKA